MRVLVADDSVLFRRLLTDVLSSFPNVEVVGSAANGKIALQKVRDLEPDLLTLDIEMPEMDGLAVLDALASQREKTLDVIVLSSVTLRGGELTLRALATGAFDFVAKPEAARVEEARKILVGELGPRIRALAHRHQVRAILNGRSIEDSQPASHVQHAAHGSPAELQPDAASGRMQRTSSTRAPEMVLVGVSTGGPVALAKLLPALPADLGVPVLVVQHMPPVFTRSLAESLAAKCAVRVREAAHGDEIQPNVVYIAPGGRQMRLEEGAHGRPVIQLTDDPPENNCRPSVDYLFRSAATRFPGRSMAVILTGMGNDGTLGLQLLKRHGCFAIAQDEASSVVYGMPKAAVDAGLADVVLPLSAIASRIVAAVRGGRG